MYEYDIDVNVKFNICWIRVCHSTSKAINLYWYLKYVGSELNYDKHPGLVRKNTFVL